MSMNRSTTYQNNFPTSLTSLLASHRLSSSSPRSTTTFRHLGFLRAHNTLVGTIPQQQHHHRRRLLSSQAGRQAGAHLLLVAILSEEGIRPKVLNKCSAQTSSPSHRWMLAKGGMDGMVWYGGTRGCTFGVPTQVAADTDYVVMQIPLL